MQDNFLAGVVEGFYGQTWTQSQRFTLHQQMADWGLNTYFYSPKDDLKHRAIWRESYDDGELSDLAALVRSCGEHGLRFIFGLSPGLDIRFSDAAELDAIKRRFMQMIELGVRDFALLFDDLPGEMTDDDLAAFDSVAAAQCSVTNSIFEWLRSQHSESRMLFCPTPYCDRMDRWNLGGDDYLDELGRTLHPEIECLWTGPEIISFEIDAASIERLTARIGRPPVIWDNLHANDYDLRRLFCGPYAGRSADMLKSVRGVLSNPNNEFGINFVPLRTMAKCLNDPEGYEPRSAYLNALQEWHRSYETVRGEIALDDLRLLADCYYLPHEEGDEGRALQDLVADLVHQPVESWGTKYDEFLERHRQVSAIFGQLTELRDRELFYAWSRRVWELREEVNLIRHFLDQRKAGADASVGLTMETHLAKTCRGGMVAALERQIDMDEDGRFRPAKGRS